MTDDFTDMRPEPVRRDIPPARMMLERLAYAERGAGVFLAVNGIPTPIRDCDWVLARPCGCVVSIMSAYSLDALCATESDAWHEMYDVEPHPHRRVRDVHIRRMQAEGWTVRVETRTEAARIHLREPDHEHDTPGSVDDD